MIPEQFSVKNAFRNSQTVQRSKTVGRLEQGSQRGVRARDLARLVLQVIDAQDPVEPFFESDAEELLFVADLRGGKALAIDDERGLLFAGSKCGLYLIDLEALDL